MMAKAVGLSTISAEMIDVEGLPILVVDRYDRSVSADGSVRRVHQEDACQALGINLDAGHTPATTRPPEALATPTSQSCCAHSAQSKKELAQLLRLAAFTSIIGNADGHGKNISFLIDADTGTITLAPAYDTVPTALWPELRNTQAMSVAGKFLIAPSFDDLVTEVASWGLTRGGASDTIEQLANAVADAWQTTAIGRIWSTWSLVEPQPCCNLSDPSDVEAIAHLRWSSACTCGQTDLNPTNSRALHCWSTSATNSPRVRGRVVRSRLGTLCHPSTTLIARARLRTHSWSYCPHGSTARTFRLPQASREYEGGASADALRHRRHMTDEPRVRRAIAPARR